jgi:serine/threonine protein kinase
MGGGKNAYQSVIEELKVLKTLSHPNIIWLNEIIDDPKKSSIYLVTEWLSRGSLLDLVEARNVGRNTRIGIPLAQALDYFRDMLKALHYCHNVAQVFHRDIKPDNIMLNHNGEAILIDFGVSALKGSNEFI